EIPSGANIPSLSKFRPKFIPDMEYRAIFSRAPAQIFLLCPNFAPNSFPIWNIARSFRGRRRNYSFFVQISPQIHSRYGISRDLFEGAGATICAEPGLPQRIGKECAARPRANPGAKLKGVFEVRAK